MCYQITLISKTGKNEYGNYRSYKNAIDEIKSLIEVGHCGVNEKEKVTFRLEKIYFSDQGLIKD